ncbi:hypothetical protein [Streptomyces sp. OE57]|uniref:hypothetical protein n=1 Tax=Streptomyces lacaronensis TaxID=3379885 RepID=UPI0039B7230E
MVRSPPGPEPGGERTQGLLRRKRSAPLSPGARGHLVAVPGDGGARDAVADLHRVVDRFVPDTPQVTAQQDPQRVTIDEIARRARIDKGTVCLHRRTEEVLFAELVRREFQGVLGVIASKIEQDPAALARLGGLPYPRARPRTTGRALPCRACPGVRHAP